MSTLMCSLPCSDCACVLVYTRVMCVWHKTGFITTRGMRKEKFFFTPILVKVECSPISVISFRTLCCAQMYDDQDCLYML